MEVFCWNWYFVAVINFYIDNWVVETFSYYLSQHRAYIWIVFVVSEVVITLLMCSHILLISVNLVHLTSFSCSLSSAILSSDDTFRCLHIERWYMNWLWTVISLVVIVCSANIIQVFFAASFCLSNCCLWSGKVRMLWKNYRFRLTGLIWKMLLRFSHNLPNWQQIGFLSVDILYQSSSLIILQQPRPTNDLALSISWCL